MVRLIEFADSCRMVGSYQVVRLYPKDAKEIIKEAHRRRDLKVYINNKRMLSFLEKWCDIKFKPVKIKRFNLRLRDVIIAMKWMYDRELPANERIYDDSFTYTMIVYTSNIPLYFDYLLKRI